MDPARGILDENRTPGLVGVVVAEEQTEGRGRQGRSWSSTRGSGIYCSIAYNFRGEVRNLLPLAAGVGIAVTLREYSPVVGLKWPNDIIVRKPVAGRFKLGGILVETTGREGIFAAVIGFGVNLSGSIGEVGISLEELTLKPFDAAELLVQLITAVDRGAKQIASGRGDLILSRFEELDLLRGREIRFRAGEGEEREGRVLGLAGDGALRVLSSRGEESLYSADVHLLEWQ